MKREVVIATDNQGNKYRAYKVVKGGKAYYVDKELADLSGDIEKTIQESIDENYQD